MNNENRNDEAVSPVIATILMVAITVVLAGVLYVWASSLAGDSAGGSLDTYAWGDKDANNDPAMSDSAGDALVEIAMDQGADLNWAMLKVTISVDDGTPITCGDWAEDEADCTWVPFEGPGNDQAWEVSEGITISEGDVDLCDGGNGGCSIDVNIIKAGVGNDADKLLASINAYAVAGN